MNLIHEGPLTFEAPSGFVRVDAGRRPPMPAGSPLYVNLVKAPAAAAGEMALPEVSSPRVSAYPENLLVVFMKSHPYNREGAHVEETDMILAGALAGFVSGPGIYESTDAGIIYRSRSKFHYQFDIFRYSAAKFMDGAYLSVTLQSGRESSTEIWQKLMTILLSARCL